MQVVPPYTVKTLSRMPEPTQRHCTEIFDDGLVIIGGTKTGRYRDNLSSVVLYDIKNNVCKQLAPLPYEVSDMATVRCTVKTDWLKQPYFLVATFLKFVILTNCELVSENDQLNLVPLTLFNWSK